MAQLVSSIAATCGLFFTAWQFVRTRRAADLQALQKFFESANGHEAALANAAGHESQIHAFNEFLNFLEVYAGAHNSRLFGRGSEKMVRHKLEDCYIELDQSPDWHAEIAKASDRATTFEELTEFVSRHRREIDDRKAQRARFVRESAV
jgi:hypothetical protein